MSLATAWRCPRSHRKRYIGVDATNKTLSFLSPSYLFSVSFLSLYWPAAPPAAAAAAAERERGGDNAALWCCCCCSSSSNMSSKLAVPKCGVRLSVPLCSRDCFILFMRRCLGVSRPSACLFFHRDRPSLSSVSVCPYLSLSVSLSHSLYCMCLFLSLCIPFGESVLPILSALLYKKMTLGFRV